jgi:hypothetical protein
MRGPVLVTVADGRFVSASSFMPTGRVRQNGRLGCVDVAVDKASAHRQNRTDRELAGGFFQASWHDLDQVPT